MSEANEAPVEIYFDERGAVSGVHVRLDIDSHQGQPVWLEFDGGNVTMFALYPEDADTVHDDFTPIDGVLFPEKSDD